MDEKPRLRTKPGLVDRIFAAIYCGVLGAVLGIVVAIAVYAYTDQLGLATPTLSGTVLGAAFGFAFPRGALSQIAEVLVGIIELIFRW